MTTGAGEIEGVVRAGDFDRGTELALEVYGDEVYGFLVNVLGDESNAEDVFAQVAEDLWRGLPRFGFRSSVRTWLYVLARNAAHRFRRSPWNRRDRRVGTSQMQGLVASVRSRTDPFRRSDVKDRFAALRAGLDVDDRTLLVLRIDRDLSWKDIARVTLDDAAADDDAIDRESTRLRKRFSLLTTQLRKLAREAGITDEDGGERAE
jgi:RNA polymerase sigma-70 factor (ECF subfamily)